MRDEPQFEIECELCGEDSDTYLATKSDQYIASSLLMKVLDIIEDDNIYFVSTL